MHPQAIACWIDSNCHRSEEDGQETVRPSLQFLGIARWGHSVQKTARIRREQINILHRHQGGCEASATSASPSAATQGTQQLLPFWNYVPEQFCSLI